MRAPESTEITQAHKDELTTRIAQSLNDDIALTLTIIPFTSVKVSTTKTLSKTEITMSHIETFLDILYPPVILLDTQIREQKQSVLITEFFSTESFDRDRFETQLNNYLEEKSMHYDVVLITRKDNQKDVEDTEKDRTQQAWENSIDTLSSNFRSRFPDDLLQKLTLQK